MNSSSLLLKVVALLAVAYLLFSFFFSDSDEELIKRVFSEVQQLATITPGEKPFEVLERTSRLLKHFEDTVVIDYPIDEDGTEYKQSVISLEKKRKIREKSIAAAKFFKELRFDFRELKVRLRGEAATVNGLVNVVGSLPGEDGVFLESHRYEFVLSKDGAVWRIGRAGHLSNERE